MQIQPKIHIEASALLSATVIVEQADAHGMTYHAQIDNLTGKTAYLRRVQLWETSDMKVCGLGEGPYTVYRSGRHKNDLPGVFTLGCQDVRLTDVLSVMVENGEGMASDGQKTVLSDHLTVVEDADGNALMITFLTGRDQLLETRLILDQAGNLEKMTVGVLFGRDVDPRESVRTETVQICVTDQVQAAVDAFAEEKARRYGSRNRRHPSVFCTWYYYGLTVSYADVARNFRMIQERHLPYEVFQVDEGWEMTLGECTPNARFPLPMRQLADEIREAGMIPGLWSSPFVAHATATVWKAHPEWILRDRQGQPCLFPMNDTVYYVFDITCPETYGYFRELYRHFTEDWGFTYHKLDFTRAAVIYEDAAFADRHITLAQAYYRAVCAIREGMGEDAFFLMCGGLYDPIIGLVDAQRTGSDVLSMWSSNINKDGKTAPYTIRQSLMRSYMNAWWANDPDALMIRKRETMDRGLRLTYGLLTDDEVKTSVINQFMSGGIMCQTEPLDAIGDDRLMEIRHILPVVDTVVHPLQFMTPDRFPGPADVYIPKTGAHCLCIINWSDTEEKKIQFRLSDVLDRMMDDSVHGLTESDACFVVCDFYSGTYLTDQKAEDVLSLPAIPPHAGTVIKIERMMDRPIIVASDGHYSMGGECEEITSENECA